MRTIRIISILLLISVLIGLSAWTVRAAPLGTPTNPGITNLVAWWSMDETSGTRYDSHGTNHLTDNNTVGYASAVKSNGADFEKDNTEYLSIADNDSLSMGSSDITFFGWVNVESPTVNSIIFIKPQEYRLFLYSDKALRFSTWDNAGNLSLVDKYSIIPGTPAFVVAWTDKANGTMNLQINNGSVTSAAVTNRNFDHSNPFSLSDSSMSYPFDGVMDEFGFYKRVLSADEREWLYNAGAGRSYSELEVPTATPTVTSTATATATNTFTPTSTTTDVPTNTATETATNTSTPTETFTPTPTETLTPTITNTPGPSRTPNGDAAKVITYGDTATVTAISLLCMVIILAFLTWLVITTLQKRKGK